MRAFVIHLVVALQRPLHMLAHQRGRVFDAAVQCLLRAVKDGSLDERQFVPVVVLAGAWAFWRGRGRPGNAELFWLGYLPGLRPTA